ncbi:MAG: zinc transporter ZupT [Mesotoga sp.]|uniref:zinc transporter ZupT n=1 Tax=unclassified Mesotoga TaxID=1184398 RepID=UPI000EF1D34B|nr:MULTISPECIES: zinc transporter ZupT [unclassified Mesotoga]MDI9368485.1 zinc transporter ZupT [Thermotogota bacterium]NLT45393.1 zinc transporter ZupT [Thermotogaceae bacterium]MDD2333176.1 zinc transporter ZupT [Mesotoga sp.]MDD3680794.1 zinc transporter ZupT [Mesotoga sp.]MDD4207463.1 zinc transporter ZupT [Mesotoga sp.]
MELVNFWPALFLTIFAGLSTGVGSILAILTKKTNTRFLSVSLGFSAGIMIYVSFVEIFVKSRESLQEAIGNGLSDWINVIAFFGGIGLIALIDFLVPSAENPHEMRDVNEMQQMNRSLMRMGVFTAFAIAVHNFPEGLATFLAAMKDPSLGIPIAIAIAIHNVPEGIAVAVPIYQATGSRKKAFIYSFLSGLAEPAGALIGFALINTLFNEMAFGVVFAGVAGIMVYISLDELLPSAEKYGEHHLSISGLIAGMALMAVSLLLL